jgi:hypothetical protein
MRRLGLLGIIAIVAGAAGGAGGGLLLVDPLVAQFGLRGDATLIAVTATVTIGALLGAIALARLVPTAVVPSPSVDPTVEAASAPSKDVASSPSAPEAATPPRATPPPTAASPIDAQSHSPSAPTPPRGPRWLPTSAEHDPGFDLQIALEGGRLIPGFPVRAALRFSAYAALPARAVRLRLSVPFESRVADAWAQTWPINGLPAGERTVVVEIAAPVGLPSGSALIAVELEGEPGRSAPRRRGGALPIG